MKRLTKYLGGFLAGVILASCGVAVLPLQGLALADDWSGWSHFKDITIQGGNTSSANYTAVPITIHLGDGTDNATDFYLHNLSRSDFGDVRFADSLGNALPYFPENYPPLEHGGISNPDYWLLNYPNAITYGNITAKVWQSGITNPQPYIAVRDNNSGIWGYPVQIANNFPLINNDHGAPSIFRTNDGYWHVIGGNLDNGLKHLRTTNVVTSINDLYSWVAMADIPGTYLRWVGTSNNTVYLWNLDRSLAGIYGIGYHKSTDNGVTIPTITYVVTDNGSNIPYSTNIAYDTVNERMWLTWTNYYDTPALRQNIYVGYLNLLDNNMYSANGTNAGATVNETEADTMGFRILASAGVFQTDMPVVRLDENQRPIVLCNVQDGTGYHFKWSYFTGVWSAFTTIADDKWQFNHGDFYVQSSTNVTAILTTGGVVSSNTGYTRGGDVAIYTGNATNLTFQNYALTAQNSSYPLNNPSFIYGSNSEFVFSQVATEQFGTSDLQIYTNNGTTPNPLPVIKSTYRVWLNVANIPAYPSTRQVRLYYGNPSATSTSDANSTFIKYNNGVTGNFTLTLAGSANVSNYPIPKTLESLETNALTDAFAYGAQMSTNQSIEFVDIRNSIGTDTGGTLYALIDAANVTSTIGTTAVAPGRRRVGVFRYNCEATTPSNFSVFYQDAAGSYWSWNGTGWIAGLTGKIWNVIGSIDVKIATNNSTIFVDVKQSDISVIGNTANIAWSSVKPFTGGVMAVASELFTDLWVANDKLTGMFLRPYMNPEPQWLGSMPNLSTGTSNVSMNKDGVTSINVTGIFGDIGSTPTQGWVDWGLTAGYGNTTANVTYTTNGTKSITLPTNLIPGQTYHWRFRATSAGGTSNGTDSTFSLTLPSVSTGTVTQSGNQATLNGNVTNMGVASSAYRYFEWWQNGVPVQTTPLGTSVAIGAYNSTITFDTLKEVSYRAVTQVGSVKSYGSTLTFSSGTIATSGNLFWTILPLIIAAAVIVFCAALFAKTLDPGLLIGGVVGGLLAYVVTVVLVNAFFR